MMPGAPRATAAGVVLPTVLLFALVLALLVGAALRDSALAARSVAWRLEAARARNLADAALELLVRRTAARWPDGGEHCAADRYCAEDYPSLRALLAGAPVDWTVSVALVPPSVLPAARGDTASASSAARYRWRRLEARVRIDGPAPVALAAGLALPRVVGSAETP